MNAGSGGSHSSGNAEPSRKPCLELVSVFKGILTVTDLNDFNGPAQIRFWCFFRPSARNFCVPGRLLRLRQAQASLLGEGLAKWYTRVVHNGFPRPPKVPYLLGFLHLVGLWKRVPPSPPVA